MPRSFAQIGTGLWNEPTIRSHTITAQRAYFLIYTQPELSRCGVLPFRLKRLAGMAADDTPTKLRKALVALEKTRHIVVDEDSEEVLLRTYVRHDGLLSQPQVVATMVQDFALVESPSIQSAFLAELRRIWDLPDLPDQQRKGLRLALGEHETDRYIDRLGAALAPAMRDAIKTRRVPAFDPTHPAGCPAPFAQGAPNPAHQGAEQGAGQALAGARAPSPTPSPTPSPVAAAAGPAGPSTRSGTGRHLLEQHQAQLGPLATVTAAHLAKHADTGLTDGATHDEILAALEQWRARPGAKPGLLPHLIADQRQASQHDPDDIGPEARAWAEREAAKRAAGGAR